ncbi:MAG TPA: hypothetical protein VK550_02250 [Polyangiaceae bacterium]|nr:hypothetical protein [Polyangiaceae bacterium]
MRAVVVQLRVPVDNAPEPECGVGILVSDKLILTAGHVIKDAKEIFVTSASLVNAGKEERRYNIANGEASLAVLGTDRSIDIGVVVLRSSWPEWEDTHSPTITALSPETFRNLQGFAFYAFHRSGMCKGQNQGEAQGLHRRAAQMDNPRYKYRDEEVLRIRPPLDRSYSGSPLALAPCGVEPWCIVGVQSMLTNDAQAQASFAFGFQDPRVRTFFEKEVGMSLDNYQDPRVAPDGFQLALGGVTDLHVGKGVTGSMVGLAGDAGWALGLGHFKSTAITFGLSYVYQWAIQTEVRSFVVAPDGLQRFASGSIPIRTAQRIEPTVGFELFRTNPIIFLGALGFSYSSYSFSDESAPSIDTPSAIGAVLRFGAGFRLARHWSFDLLVSARMMGYSYAGSRYTLVPGVLASEPATATGGTAGLKASLAYW